MYSLPTLFNYGENNQKNNCGVSVNGVDYYFSYRTVVAFRSIETGLVCMKNHWGNTTGKHLNWIEPDHSKRVSEKEFKKLLAKV